MHTDAFGDNSSLPFRHRRKRCHFVDDRDRFRNDFSIMMICRAAHCVPSLCSVSFRHSTALSCDTMFRYSVLRHWDMFRYSVLRHADRWRRGRPGAARGSRRPATAANAPPAARDRRPSGARAAHAAPRCCRSARHRARGVTGVSWVRPHARLSVPATRIKPSFAATRCDGRLCQLVL